MRMLVLLAVAAAFSAQPPTSGSSAASSYRYEAVGGGELTLYSARIFPALYHIQGLDRELVDMHMSLYRGYVNQTNELLIKLRQISRSAQRSSLLFGALSRRLGWEYNGMRLHELYFENFGGSGVLDPGSSLFLALKGAFGSLENWRREFIQLGNSRGVGWVMLAIDPKTGDFFNQWIDEHDIGALIGVRPLVVMDVWEHAYITQFGLNRGAYIELFLKNIDWNTAEQRFEASAL